MNNTVLLVSKTTAELPFTMTFDANGGISDTIQRDVIVGEKIGDLPNATYGGKYFDGWFSSRIGGTRISADTLAGAQFKTVYAHWIDPVAIDFDATTNGGTLVPHDYKYYPTVPFGNLPEAEGPSDKPHLDGWWTTASGDGVKISTSDVVGDVRKYYARYIGYNDPIGKIICPTRNLYFTTEDGKYFWTPSDASIQDGSGYLEAYAQNGISTWYYFSSNWWNNNYMTMFKTSVTGPGTLTFDLWFEETFQTNAMQGIAVVSDDEFADGYNNDLYANYLSNMYSIGGSSYSGNMTREGITAALNSQIGSDLGANGNVSYIAGFNQIQFSGSMTFTDSYTHPITIICGGYDSNMGSHGKISNVCWFPSQGVS